MKILCLDLEYNNNLDEGNTSNSKVTDIIQIGAVVLDTDTGDIIDTFEQKIKIYTPLDNGELRLSKFITKLTGITDQQIESEGVSMLEAYEKLVDFCRKNEVSRIAATWGNGDLQDLRNQVEYYINTFETITKRGLYEEEIETYNRKILECTSGSIYTFYEKQWSGWYFSKYDYTGFFDIKKVYQLYRISNNQKHSGGMRKAMNYLGLKLPPNMSYHDALADAYGSALILHKLMGNFK